jgi:hypothetical protein
MTVPCRPDALMISRRKFAFCWRSRHVANKVAPHRYAFGTLTCSCTIESGAEQRFADQSRCAYKALGYGANHMSEGLSEADTCRKFVVPKLMKGLRQRERPREALQRVAGPNHTSGRGAPIKWLMMPITAISPAIEASRLR